MTQQPASQQTHNGGSGVGTGRSSSAANGRSTAAASPFRRCRRSPGRSSGRRPLSNEDFEEELDIPEFLKQ